MFNSPLEQFNLLPVFKVPFFGSFFTFTNQTFMILVVFAYLYILIQSFSYKNTISFKVIPNRWQLFLEKVYKLVLNIVRDNLDLGKGEPYFPYIFTIFVYILVFSGIGLVPYSYTITSQLIVTFTVALFTFIGLNIKGVQIHKMHFLSVFLPSGTSFYLGFLLMPIEFISHVFKPISLSIRLFANMMAGHALLKVMAGFSWILCGLGGGFILISLVPTAITFILLFLEAAVAVIQAFVFSILICIYLKDIIDLH